MIRYAAFLAVMICATAARADWQYTKWGMTPEQVVAASKGKMRRCSPASCNGQSTDAAAAQLYGEYSTGEFAMFDKRSTKLSSITLKLWEATSADSLVGAVRTKYGEPVTQSRDAIMGLYVWRDQRDQISVLVTGRGDTATASLQYQPRLNEANKGL